MNNISIGTCGEDLAQEYLLKLGFELLHRNWRNGRYEIDIVARRGDMLHIVEVKTRKAGSIAAPEDAMTRAKFKALCRAVQIYISSYKIEADISFDLVAIDYSSDGPPAVRYIPNVMYPVW